MPFLTKNPQLTHLRRCRGVLQQTWLHLLRAVAVVGVILIVISLGGSDPSCTIKICKIGKIVLLEIVAETASLVFVTQVSSFCEVPPSFLSVGVAI